MTEADVDAEWTALRARWPELFVLLDAVDLRLSPRRCAERLGLRSSAELEREMRTRGMPRFRLLRDWTYVEALCAASTAKGSLAALAASRGDYLSVLSRFVLRVTGRTWQHFSRLALRDVRTICLTAIRIHSNCKE